MCKCQCTQQLMANLRSLEPLLGTDFLKHSPLMPPAARHSTLATPGQQSSHSKEDGYYCEKDLVKGLECVFELQEGQYYWPNVSSAEAKLILKPQVVGTFFIRDSSDPKYLYTISVKTKRGPTSIRIMYDHGRFSLDSDEKSQQQIPKFTSLLELVDYYVRLNKYKKSEQCRFLDRNGKKDLPIIFSKPHRSGVSSLQHLCRTAITRTLPASSCQEVVSLVDEIKELPKPLRSYIKNYPYQY